MTETKYHDAKSNLSRTSGSVVKSYLSIAAIQTCANQFSGASCDVILLHTTVHPAVLYQANVRCKRQRSRAAMIAYQSQS